MSMWSGAQTASGERPIVAMLNLESANGQGVARSWKLEHCSLAMSMNSE